MIFVRSTVVMCVLALTHQRLSVSFLGGIGVRPKYRGPNNYKSKYGKCSKCVSVCDPITEILVLSTSKIRGSDGFEQAHTLIHR